MPDAMTTEGEKAAVCVTAAESDTAAPETTAAVTREPAVADKTAGESAPAVSTSQTTSGPETTAGEPAAATTPQTTSGPETTAGADTATLPDTATERRQKVFDWLDRHGIAYTWYEHPEAPTIEIARRYWRDDGSKHCKNLFFRNHKGNRHYLVAFDCEQNLAIHDLEHRLRQGKLSFASQQRMERWLGVRPGSVSPFGLINDPEGHVHLFLDRNLERFPAYSFHPNDNRATVVIARSEFLRYLAAVGNTYEFIELY